MAIEAVSRRWIAASAIVPNSLLASITCVTLGNECRKRRVISLRQRVGPAKRGNAPRGCRILCRWGLRSAQPAFHVCMLAMKDRRAQRDKPSRRRVLHQQHPLLVPRAAFAAKRSEKSRLLTTALRFLRHPAARVSSPFPRRLNSQCQALHQSHPVSDASNQKGTQNASPSSGSMLAVQMLSCGNRPENPSTRVCMPTPRSLRSRHAGLCVPTVGEDI